MRWFVAVLLSACALGSSVAQDVPAADATPAAADEAVHEELRALKETCQAAINAGDVETLLEHLHPNVVITWPTGEVSRGREGVEAFYQKLFSGPDAQLEQYSTTATVDELTILHGGDTGIAWGEAQDVFTVKGGGTSEMLARWTATVVRHEGRWVLASFAGSVDPFDNPVLKTAASGAGLTGGVVGLLVGLLVGMLGVKLASARSPTP